MYKKGSLVVAFVLLIVFPIVSAGLFSDVWDKMTGQAVSNYGDSCVGVICDGTNYCSNGACYELLWRYSTNWKTYSSTDGSCTGSILGNAGGVSGWVYTTQAVAESYMNNQIGTCGKYGSKDIKHSTGFVLNVSFAEGWCQDNPSSCKSVAVTYSCTGDFIPNGAERHSSEEQSGLTSDKAWIYSADDTIVKCEYKCKTGFIRSDNLCVPVAYSCTPESWSPDASTVCSHKVFTQVSDCGTTKSVSGTKTGSSCFGDSCVKSGCIDCISEFLTGNPTLVSLSLAEQTNLIKAKYTWWAPYIINCEKEYGSPQVLCDLSPQLGAIDSNGNCVSDPAGPCRG